MFFKDKRNIKVWTLEHIPAFIRKDYPLFIKLMEHYLEFLEQEGLVLYNLEHIQEHNRYDSPHNKFWDRIYEDAGFNFSSDLKIDKRQFFNYLMDFYMYRGSLQGLKFIISVLYDESCEVRYPREELLIPSQAEYGYNQYICVRLDEIDVNLYRKLLAALKEFNVSVKSSSSGDTLDVENIYTFKHKGKVYLNLKVNYKALNKFKVGEQLTIFTDTLKIIGTNTPFIKLEIKRKGILHRVGERVEIRNGINNGLVTIKKITKGSIDSLEIKNAGQDYKVGDYITATKRFGMTGEGFYAEIEEVSPTGEITKVNLLNKGYSYEELPTLFIHSKTGSNGVINPKTTTIGGIVEFDYKENYAINLDTTAITELDTLLHTKEGQNASLGFIPVVTNKTSSFYRDGIGFISNKSYLIDSLYYQQFCYKIDSAIPRYVYDPVVDVMSHPAGHTRYAAFRLVDLKKKLIDKSKKPKAVITKETI